MTARPTSIKDTPRCQCRAHPDIEGRPPTRSVVLEAVVEGALSPNTKADP
jgi:hypothetical protein